MTRTISMKRLAMILALTVAVTFSLGSALMLQSAEAKGKVVKVTTVKFCKTHSAKCYDKFYGKTKSGKVVWKFKSKKYIPAQCYSTSHKIKGKYVYINDCGVMKKLRLKSGKVVKKANKKVAPGGHLAIDKKGSVYVGAQLGSAVYKLNKNLKYKWRTTISVKDELAIYKIKVKNGKVIVTFSTFDLGYKKHVLNASDGRQLK